MLWAESQCLGWGFTCCLVGTPFPSSLFYIYVLFSGTSMIGRPGHHKMEMNGRSTVSYLVRTRCVPFFMLLLVGLEAKGLLAFQGRRGIASVVQWNLRPVIFGVDICCSPTPPPPLPTPSPSFSLEESHLLAEEHCLLGFFLVVILAVSFVVLVILLLFSFPALLFTVFSLFVVRSFGLFQ